MITNMVVARGVHVKESGLGCNTYNTPYPNVDLGSGTLLHSVGFRKPDYYTTFFGWARVAGICAQILDERNAREGRGTPIYRPKYIPRNQPHRRL